MTWTASYCASLTTTSTPVSRPTCPANGSTYWNGEALNTTDYKDLEEAPEVVRSMTDTLARNTVHLSRLLQDQPYPSA